MSHPINVQNEIFERYNTAVKQKELENAHRQRDDMVEFLAAYHEESTDETPDPESEDS